MSKNESDFHTGMSTSASRRVVEKKKVVAEKKAENQRKLEPISDVVLDVIKRERENIPKQVWDFISLDDTQDRVKETLLALRMYESYLQGLEIRIINTLRVSTKAKK